MTNTSRKLYPMCRSLWQVGFHLYVQAFHAFCLSRFPTPRLSAPQFFNSFFVARPLGRKYNRRRQVGKGGEGSRVLAISVCVIGIV